MAHNDEPLDCPQYAFRHRAYVDCVDLERSNITIIDKRAGEKTREQTVADVPHLARCRYHLIPPPTKALVIKGDALRGRAVWFDPILPGTFFSDALHYALIDAGVRGWDEFWERRPEV